MKRSTRVIGLAALVVASSTAQAASLSEGDARRFLSQASFGPTDASVNEVMASSKAAWIAKQFTLASSDYAGFSYLDPSTTVGCPTGSASTCYRDNYTLFPIQQRFFQNALGNDDQLRQRVALALSEIMVTSGQQIRQPYAMANYQRIFLAGAFGNFRDILKAVTLSPAMGNFLNMANNDKPNPARGTQPNENYAREVLQLFSIGLHELNPDGSPKLDAKGAVIPTYDQDVVEGFAHAFTGWTYPPRAGATAKFPSPVNFSGPMVAFADHHDGSAKKLLNGTTTAAGQSPQADLDAAIDSIFAHPNLGPFIGRQLIQQFVTSNPSPAYVARVSAAFNGAGGAKRGDMKAVIAAVLLDTEASRPASPPAFGKLREPVLQLTHLLRALGGQSDGVWLQSQAAALGEPVFSPATVFGFFPPDYALPDFSGQEGPAFGVYNATSAFTLSGVFATALSSAGVAADPSVPGATGTHIDLGHWKALASNPASLSADINRVLFGGRMSASLAQAVEKAALSQPATNPAARAQAALFIAVMAPEYLVEH